MENLRWIGRGLIAVTLVGIGFAVLVACSGGSSPRLPEGTRSVQGQAVLPAGHGLNLSTLRVTTPYGGHPVDAAGRFSATVDADEIMELSLETASGDLVLLGTSRGNQVQLSADSTAKALIYYAIGGMFIPSEHQNKVRTLLDDVNTSGLAAHVTRMLAAGSNGLTDPDEAMAQAIEQAAADALVAPTFLQYQVLPADYSTMQESDSHIIIHSGTTSRSGGQVLHDPNGNGIVVQNSHRRPAALLIYEVASNDADGTTTPIDPPRLASTIEVPATGKLELLNALYDVVTGGAPFSPVLSPPADLVGVSGASRTYYELVLIGASTNSSDWPIVNDPRFSGEQSHWHDVYTDMAIKLFMDELLMPIIETYALGNVASIDAAKLSAFRDRSRIIYGKHLQNVGVHLTYGQTSYAHALRSAMFEISNNGLLRTDMLEAVAEALDLGERNKLNMQAMERRLAGRASASAVVAAVQGIMLTGDVAGILSGISSSHWAVNWQAESMPVLFVLNPTEVQMHALGSGQARFIVEPRQSVTGNFLYRWSTSGNHGTISDYFQDGLEFDTDSNDVFYTHNWPLNMVEGQTDTVTVEVYSVEAGATTIPPGAEAIFRRTATITVFIDDFCRGREPWCDDYYCWCHPGTY